MFFVQCFFLFQYNVALKQEDGEQVTEEDISALYQDASQRLRTSLRTKAPTRSLQPRKSLRHKILRLQNTEPDAGGDIEVSSLFSLVNTIVTLISLVNAPITRFSLVHTHRV